MLSIKQKPIIQNTNSLNHAQKPALGQAGLSQARFQCHDIISFKKSEGPSQETIDYINQVRKGLEAKGEKLESLSQLDLNEIQDIAKGIKLFDGFSALDLAFVSKNFDAIFLQRGCVHQCLHCGADAENKVTAMPWENFQAIAEGMGELKNRLGFNIFIAKKENFVYPFIDSDPMLYKANFLETQANGSKKFETKNIYDAAKLFYDKTETKFVITTAGWNPKSNFSQTAALKFTEDPNTISIVCLSIGPFHRFMADSLKYFKEAIPETDEIKREQLFKKSNDLKNKYIDMIADNLITLWPLVKTNQLTIGALFDKSPNEYWFSKHYETSIIQNIFDKMKEKIRQNHIVLDPQFTVDDFNRIIADRFITYIGRASNFEKEKTPQEHRFKFLQDYFFNETMKHKDTKVQPILQNPIRINTDGTFLINLIGDESYTGNILPYTVELTGKKLTLPIHQIIKTEKHSLKSLGHLKMRLKNSSKNLLICPISSKENRNSNYNIGNYILC